MDGRLCVWAFLKCILSTMIVEMNTCSGQSGSGVVECGGIGSQVDERTRRYAFRPGANGGIGGWLSGMRETIVSTRVFPQGALVTLLIPCGASFPLGSRLFCRG